MTVCQDLAADEACAADDSIVNLFQEQHSKLSGTKDVLNLVRLFRPALLGLYHLLTAAGRCADR